MKKMAITITMLMVLFVMDQRTWAHMLTYMVVGMAVLGTVVLVLCMGAMVNKWYQRYVYTSIQEWRERDRYRARTLAQHRHINRLK